jgi:hypothetical protein
MLPLQAALLHPQRITEMEIATLIGFGMLALFLVLMIINIWKDNRRESRLWNERNNKRDN